MNLKKESRVIVGKLEREISEKIDIPSSKSLSIRALIIAAFADGYSTITNVLDSDDTNSCISALQSLGIQIKRKENTVEVMGCNNVLLITKDTNVFVESSGITSRFLLSFLANSKTKYNITLDGTQQLRNRIIQPLVNSLKIMGANIDYLEKDGYLPLLIKPAKLNLDYIEISGKESSQYVSSMLMMSPLLENEINIKPIDIDSENHPYIKMALKTMQDFSIKYEENDGIYTIKPQKYKGNVFAVETDFNSANYFFALASAAKSKIKIDNLNLNTMQPGILFLDVLKKMGSLIEYKNNSIIVTGNNLKGDFSIDMFNMAEMTMTLAILAVFADKPVEIHGVSHIKNHESNRIRTLCEELKKLGILCDEYDDGLKIYPGEPNNALIDSHDDHRIAMSFAILGACGNGISISNPSCVSKTFPEFFELLEKIGVKIEYKF